MLGPTALAAALGISRQMVYQYEREGKIQRRDGKFDLEEVRRQLAANLGTKQGGPPRKGMPAVPAPAAGRRIEIELEPQPHGGSLKREHAIEDELGANFLEENAPAGSKVDLEKKLLAERFRRARLQNDQSERILIDADEAMKAWGNMITTARNKALMLPSELSRKVAYESDPVVCEEILKAGIDAMLSELAEWRPETVELPIAG